MSKMKDILTDRQETRRLKNRAILKEFFWGVCLVFALCVVLSFFEADADDSGIYFKTGASYIGGDWEYKGIPWHFDIGYKGEHFEHFIGKPSWYVNYQHLSDFSGAIVGEALGTEDDGDTLDVLHIGLCWGAC